ncbi:MAG: hypothetical protein HZA36_03100, partial [Parcubacteria group bacterium]|nr:hypothetical protein [Parcubacteria group bacterium]
MKTQTKPTNAATMNATEKEAGKEVKIQPLTEEAMSLNVRFVRKDSPIKWSEDVIPAAEKKGASLNIAEFAAMVGLTSEAGQFLIGEEAGLHRSKLNAVALNNLANKR